MTTEEEKELEDLNKKIRQDLDVAAAQLHKVAPEAFEIVNRWITALQLTLRDVDADKEKLKKEVERLDFELKFSREEVKLLKRGGI